MSLFTPGSTTIREDIVDVLNVVGMESSGDLGQSIGDLTDGSSPAPDCTEMTSVTSSSKAIVDNLNVVSMESAGDLGQSIEALTDGPSPAPVCSEITSVASSSDDIVDKLNVAGMERSGDLDQSIGALTDCSSPAPVSSEITSVTSSSEAMVDNLNVVGMERSDHLGQSIGALTDGSSPAPVCSEITSVMSSSSSSAVGVNMIKQEPLDSELADGVEIHPYDLNEPKGTLDGCMSSELTSGISPSSLEVTTSPQEPLEDELANSVVAHPLDLDQPVGGTLASPMSSDPDCMKVTSETSILAMGVDMLQQKLLKHELPQTNSAERKSGDSDQLTGTLAGCASSDSDGTKETSETAILATSISMLKQKLLDHELSLTNSVERKSNRLTGTSGGCVSLDPDCTRITAATSLPTVQCTGPMEASNMITQLSTLSCDTPDEETLLGTNSSSSSLLGTTEQLDPSDPVTIVVPPTGQSVKSTPNQHSPVVEQTPQPLYSGLASTNVEPKMVPEVDDEATTQSSWQSTQKATSPPLQGQPEESLSAPQTVEAGLEQCSSVSDGMPGSSPHLLPELGGLPTAEPIACPDTSSPTSSTFRLVPLSELGNAMVPLESLVWLPETRPPHEEAKDKCNAKGIRKRKQLCAIQRVMPPKANKRKIEVPTPVEPPKQSCIVVAQDPANYPNAVPSPTAIPLSGSIKSRPKASKDHHVIEGEGTSVFTLNVDSLKRQLSASNMVVRDQLSIMQNGGLTQTPCIQGQGTNYQASNGSLGILPSASQIASDAGFSQERLHPIDRDFVNPTSVSELDHVSKNPTYDLGTTSNGRFGRFDHTYASDQQLAEERNPRNPTFNVVELSEYEIIVIAAKENESNNVDAPGMDDQVKAAGDYYEDDDDYSEEEYIDDADRESYSSDGYDPKEDDPDYTDCEDTDMEEGEDVTNDELMDVIGRKPEPRTPPEPRTRVRSEDMEKTFSCKLCDFQSHSVQATCVHLLQEHKDSVVHLSTFLSKTGVNRTPPNIGGTNETEGTDETEETTVHSSQDDKVELEKGIPLDSNAEDDNAGNTNLNGDMSAMSAGEDNGTVEQGTTVHVSPDNSDEMEKDNPVDINENIDSTFEDRSPMPAGKDIELVEKGVTMHSVINGRQVLGKENPFCVHVGDECIPGDGNTKPTCDGNTDGGDKNVSGHEIPIPDSVRDVVRNNNTAAADETQGEDIQGEKSGTMDNASMDIINEKIRKNKAGLFSTLLKYTKVTYHCPLCGHDHNPVSNTLRFVHCCQDCKKTVLCDHCGKAFSKRSFDAHFNRQHAAEVMVDCQICGEEVANKTLQSHIKKKHGRKKQPCECPICGKVLASKARLAVHEQIHRKERPFKCAICQKGFSQRSNMAIHMRQHTGEQPYQCDQCPKAFTNKVCLKSHLKKYHGIDLWKQGHTGGGRPKTDGGPKAGSRSKASRRSKTDGGPKGGGRSEAPRRPKASRTRKNSTSDETNELFGRKDKGKKGPMQKSDDPDYGGASKPAKKRKGQKESIDDLDNDEVNRVTVVTVADIDLDSCGDRVEEDCDPNGVFDNNIMSKIKPLRSGVGKGHRLQEDCEPGGLRGDRQNYLDETSRIQNDDDVDNSMVSKEVESGHRLGKDGAPDGQKSSDETSQVQNGNEGSGKNLGGDTTRREVCLPRPGTEILKVSRRGRTIKRVKRLTF